MNRRKFFKYGGLAAAGTALLSPFEVLSNNLSSNTKDKKAKNIIVLISDGMSIGTLNMADLYANRILGHSTNWMKLYQENKVSRALMDTASASSIVTDSSAASSAFGGGVRVKNGTLNISESGKENLPLFQKLKQKGKKVGCVTTVTVTHATPAGFCVCNNSRNAQAEIAEAYLELEIDVLLGGGNQFFDPQKRKDNKNLYKEYSDKGYEILRSREEMLNSKANKPILGIFSEDALPYSIDRNASKELQETVPTLAEMTKIAIENLKKNTDGFALQVEGGKVDWGAHANDISAIIHDQLAFDEAIKVAIDFAEKDGNTLVVITTDHGNANPGVIYGRNANTNFDSIADYTQTNEYILNQIQVGDSISNIKSIINQYNKIELTDEEAQHIKSYYDGLEKKEEGLYNYKKIPFKYLAEIQKSRNSVGWISMDHSADYVELAIFGPGSHLLKPFIKNTDVHHIILEAAHIENKF